MKTPATPTQSIALGDTAPAGLPPRLRAYRAVADRLQTWQFRGHGRLCQAWARVLFPRLPGETCLPTPWGFALHVDPRRGKGLEQALFFQGTYETGTLHIMRQVLRPGDTFVDIGANIGLMSLFAARQVGPAGQVHAFEPLPATRTLLEKNVAANGLAHVRVHSTALGANRETRPLFAHAERNRGCASFLPGEEETMAHTAEIRPLEDVLPATDTPPRMIKIDVEGWELDVLRGAARVLSNPCPPVLCVECTAPTPPRDDHRQALCDLLREAHGYELFLLAGSKERPSPLVLLPADAPPPRHDNLFCIPGSRLEEFRSSLGT